MTLLQFAQRLNSLTERSSLIAAIGSFVDDHSDEKVDNNKLKAYVNSIVEDDFTSFGQNLGFCKNHCLNELAKEENKDDADYYGKLTKVKQLLDELSKVYQNINDERTVAEAQSGESYTIDQQKDVLRELVFQTKQLKTEVDKANQDIDKANDSLDNKMFTLLINTVAILGIFVAIAFAGLGITSLFNALDFTTAFASKENFIRTVFFLFLVALLSYNLLLLLVYFIYKLSRPIFMDSVETKDEKNSKRFKDSIYLKPFFVVDGILFAVIIALFAWGIFTYSNDNIAGDNVSPDEESYVNSEITSGEDDTDPETIVGDETT